MPSPLTYDLKNINVDTVENCNLLCKLVMDYMFTDKCEIEVIPSSDTPDDIRKRSFRIVYPEGSFINYKDTNYELTYAYFFYPSRHSIDGERYDLEVNIYHGIFQGDDNKRGIVAHTHYHNDDDDPTTYQHKHFHYHLAGDDTDADKAHDIPDGDNHTEKNVVTCLLYNMGKHIGNDVNIFFNQFIHHPKFKRIKTSEDISKFDVNVHDNWTIEKIYPKKRSYFMYDDDNNTYVVFDTIQTISKEIIDRIYERGIKGAFTKTTDPKNSTGFDLNNISSFSVEPLTNVLYRKNIEVITDEQYKKTKRAQIKDLLSLSRMSTYKPSKKTSKEYYQDGEQIIKTITGGSNTGYLTNEEKAKTVADIWKYYGRDKPIEKEIKNIRGDKWLDIVFKQEYLKKYGYLERIYKYFKGKEDTSFDKDHPDFQTYIDERKAVKTEDENKRNREKARHEDDDYDQEEKNTYDASIKHLGEPEGREKSAFFHYIPPGSDEEKNKKKVRFFFEELTPGWNAKHGIDFNVISKLNETGLNETLREFGGALNALVNTKYSDLAEELIFVEEGPELERTLSNEECQHWLSNETHYEGDLWKFWEEPVKIAKNSRNDFTSLPLEARKKIGEGLMEYDDTQIEDDKPITKWYTHNKCRNPGNRAAAPWCYTKNPNKRWEYCAKPYYSDILGKIVLLAIFVFIGVIAFYAIKKIFFYEYPMRFVAQITGGTLATKDTFTASPGATQPPSK